jgi:predicted RNase H-like nuclease (RuvC/YqgF family)
MINYGKADIPVCLKLFNYKHSIQSQAMWFSQTSSKNGLEKHNNDLVRHINDLDRHINHLDRHINHLDRHINHLDSTKNGYYELKMPQIKREIKSDAL